MSKHTELSDEEITAEKSISIHSNGSKWAGEEPDSIETLLSILEKYDLDLRSFAACGFINFSDGKVVLQGNFITLSHVFHIEGLEEAPSIKALMCAIESNIDKQMDKFEQATTKAEAANG